jgi:hypothetical protein
MCARAGLLARALRRALRRLAPRSLPTTSTPDIPVGRWTRGSFTYDQHNKRRVFLKDSWHVLLDDVKPEGEIYRLLYEKGVPNIPFFSLAGDVGNEAYH